MIRDVYLHGAPGRLFGRHFRLDVSSPAEAVRALVCLRPRFRQWLRDGAWRIIVGPPRLRYGIEAEALQMSLGTQPLHFVPATRPRGGDAGKTIGFIVVGVILVAAAFYLAPAAAAGAGIFGADLAATGAVGMTFGSMAMLGVSMIAGGVAALLTASPITGTDDATQRAAPGDRPSFLFNGVTNNTQAGGPVPVVIGTHLVGSVVVSAALQSEDIA